MANTIDLPSGPGALRRRQVLQAGVMGTGALLAAGPLHAENKRGADVPAERYVTGSPWPDLRVEEVNAPQGIANLAGVDLWYWDTGGNGPTIVLLHPATGSGHVWGYQQAAFASAGYRVIGYSRRGHRGSSSGDPAQPGTGAGDLAMLMDHLGLTSVHLVGTAAGGFVAAAYALEYADRVSTLTIACSIVSVSDPQVRELVPWLYEAWWNQLPHDLRELSASYRAVNRTGHARWNELYAQSRAGNPPVNQPAGATALLSTMSRLSQPTLLVYGGADLLSPPPIGRILSSAIPDSELVILTECGHSAYWERPHEFNAAVLEFIQLRG